MYKFYLSMPVLHIRQVIIAAYSMLWFSEQCGNLICLLKSFETVSATLRVKKIKELSLLMKKITTNEGSHPADT